MLKVCTTNPWNFLRQEWMQNFMLICVYSVFHNWASILASITTEPVFQSIKIYSAHYKYWWNFDYAFLNLRWFFRHMGQCPCPLFSVPCQDLAYSAIFHASIEHCCATAAIKHVRLTCCIRTSLIEKPCTNLLCADAAKCRRVVCYLVRIHIIAAGKGNAPAGACLARMFVYSLDRIPQKRKFMTR